MFSFKRFKLKSIPNLFKIKHNIKTSSFALRAISIRILGEDQCKADVDKSQTSDQQDGSNKLNHWQISVPRPIEFTGEATKAFNGKWITVSLMKFKNYAQTGIKEFEVVSRPAFQNQKTHQTVQLKDKYGGVDVIATTECQKTKDKLILLEINYRVPIQRYVISFPAGFQDPEDKDPAETALRELKEETGYIGSNPKVSLRHWTDPWKSMDRGVFVYMDIDMKNEKNRNLETNLEFFENITP